MVGDEYVKAVATTATACYGKSAGSTQSRTAMVVCG